MPQVPLTSDTVLDLSDGYARRILDNAIGQDLDLHRLCGLTRHEQDHAREEAPDEIGSRGRFGALPGDLVANEAVG